MSKRIYSLMLALALLLSLIPAQALPVHAADAPVISAADTFCMPGGQVDVKVRIKNNPGILGAALRITYEEGLTLVDAKNGDAFSALNLTKPGKFESPCNFVWDGLDQPSTSDGAVLILTFEADENAELEKALAIEVWASEDAIQDADMDPIDVSFTDGSILVIDYIPGDVNGDGAVTIKDIIMLRQYIAGGYGVEINESAGNVDQNSSITTADIITMRRVKAGGYKDKNGDELELKPAPIECNHRMTGYPAIDATCTESGRIAYWYCDICERYFKDNAGKKEITLEDTVTAPKGHTIVTDPYKAPTPTETGLTEGSHCSVCGLVIVPQDVIPSLTAKEHNIVYEIANGDTYIRELVASGQVDNSANPLTFTEENGAILSDIEIPGYQFEGWYYGATASAQKLPTQYGSQRVEKGTDADIKIYAHWEKITYKVQFKSSIYLDEYEKSFTVDTGTTLPTPKLSNYVFTGWTDEEGHLYSSTMIPKGTAKNITLTANWMSERNKAITKTKLDDPIILERDNQILFVYEIGRIENVPLQVLKDFGYIEENGVKKSETTTYKIQTTETLMDSYTRSVANATTESSSWTLSEDWNETTTINESWARSKGITEQDVETYAKSSTGTWNISSGRSGTAEVAHSTANESGWEVSSKVGGGFEQEFSEKESTTNAWNIGGNVGYSAGSAGGVQGGINGGYNHSKTTEEGYKNTDKFNYEDIEKNTGSTLDTSSAKLTSGWNTSASYGGSSTASHTSSTSRAVSESITNNYGYGESYNKGGESSTTAGESTTNTASNGYTNSTTFSTVEGEEHSSTWTTQATKAGYHRWILAGTAHVFAVVGYDIASQSFYVTTQSVMDDETHEFEDYSYTSAAYNDEENGVISFEVPYFVNEYIAKRVTFSSGLVVNQETGVVERYTGSENFVVIPEYYNVGGGRVVRITGIGETAFKGNTNIVAVDLSDFITEIPANAFKGCTSLIGLSGGGVQKIGSSAFAGCTSMKDVVVGQTVTSLGNNAFNGTDRLFAFLSEDGVAEAAINSGAKEIVLYAEGIRNGSEALSNRTLSVPEGTKYFEIDGWLEGDGKTPAEFIDLIIESEAEKTVLKNISLTSTGKRPLTISSSDIIFNTVEISAPGIAAAFTGDAVRLGMQGTIRVASENDKAMLTKDLTLYESNDKVTGKLSLTGKLLICGEIEGTSLLSGGYEMIDPDTFNKYLSSYTLTFDANGGTCTEETREVSNSTEIGALPVAEREHYDFAGWFTDATSGTQVTETTVFSSGEDITLFAHWQLHSFTVSWNAVSHCAITVTRTASPYGGAAAGTLTSGAVVYYGDVLSVAYTADSGYNITSRGLKDIVVDRSYTASDIYCSTGGSSYTYDIVYKSSNGAILGSSTHTGTFNTVQIITPPEKDGYITPDAQSVAWDSTTPKTITFVYTPKTVSTATLKNNAVWWKSSSGKGIRYTLTVEFLNRTETSVDAKITWTNKILAGSYFGYKQAFTMSVGGVSTGKTTIATASDWSSSSSKDRTKTATVTITITGLSADTTSLSYSVSTTCGGTHPDPFSGTLTIPTY